mgnify:CR=1 FL=1
MIISSYVTIAPGIWLVTAKRAEEEDYIEKTVSGSIAQAMEAARALEQQLKEEAIK